MHTLKRGEADSRFGPARMEAHGRAAFIRKHFYKPDGLRLQWISTLMAETGVFS
jgi:hypothetical protein